MYFTHHGLVEQSLPHNAFSIVEVGGDCSVTVRGYVDALNATVPGPPGHVCRPR